MKLHHRSLGSISRRLVHVAAALLCSVGALGARAAAPGFADDGVDPPGRVGRISDTTGQVWLYAPEAGEWVSAVRNRPITTGNRLSTDGGARAEVRIGSTTLRLDSGAELEVLRLDDERIALQLHNGGASVRLRSRESAAEFEMVTGEGRFRTQRSGRYRFDRSDEASHLTVYSGQAMYEGPGSALTVYSGQRAEFWIDTASAAQYSITEPRRDAFAAWNSERDRSDDRSASARYVSPEMTGAEDLDRHGRWEESPEYGSLWIPRVVAPGWAPYSTGHWTWVHPWGWTWVDDAPWGFAPFHYGRWVWFRSAWCWAPGTLVHRPVYAPALVAWVGGPHVSASISIGGAPAVGWFPLAPREVYVPTYRTSPRYVRNVNVTHGISITNVAAAVNNAQTAPQRDFSNRKFPHAVTVVPASVMTQRQPVAPAAAQLRDSPVVRELARDPGRNQVSLAAPVAPARAQDTRAPTGTQPMVPPSPSARMNRPPSDRGAEGRAPALPPADRGAPQPTERRGQQPQDTARTAPALPVAPAARPQVTATPPAPSVQSPTPPVPQPPEIRQTQPGQAQSLPNGQAAVQSRPAPRRDAAERGGQPVPSGDARSRMPRPTPVEATRAAPPSEAVAPRTMKRAHEEPRPQGRPSGPQPSAAPPGQPPAEAQSPRGRREGQRDGREERPRERIQ